VWFSYEELLAKFTDRRQAAYFDLGVEHGIAAAAANGLTNAMKTQRAIAKRIVQEVIRTGVARDEVVGALLVAAWAILGRTPGRPGRTASRLGGLGRSPSRRFLAIPIESLHLQSVATKQPGKIRRAAAMRPQFQERDRW
jgi:hypothetical protein